MSNLTLSLVALVSTLILFACTHVDITEITETSDTVKLSAEDLQQMEKRARTGEGAAIIVLSGEGKALCQLEECSLSVPDKPTLDLKRTDILEMLKLQNQSFASGETQEQYDGAIDFRCTVEECAVDLPG